jgi:hypothetical protein
MLQDANDEMMQEAMEMAEAQNKVTCEAEPSVVGL